MLNEVLTKVSQVNDNLLRQVTMPALFASVV